MKDYNITGLAKDLEKIRLDYPELGSDEIMTLIQFDERYNKNFNARFSGNELRRKNGLGQLDPATYLGLEQGYKKVFTSYGLTSFDNTAKYAEFIGNNIDSDEVNERVQLAYDRVLNDTSVTKAFKSFYSSITDADIVSALLDPKAQAPALEKKVLSAEIGGEAMRQGLAASLQQLNDQLVQGKSVSGYSNVQRGTLGAEAISGTAGVTRATVAKDYQTIAEELPAAEKLSSIYSYALEQYGQREAEQANIQELASAKRKKTALKEAEEAAFLGQSGMGRVKSRTSGRF